MASRTARKRAHQVRLFLFGAFRLEAAGREPGKEGDWRPVRLPRRKVEALLAYLAIHPQAHAREMLAALFWGDSPDAQARTSLRTSLAVLRKQLGDDLLLTDRDAVQLNPDYPLWTDVRAFEAQQPHEPLGALRWYQGDLLQGVYDDWALAEREHYRGLYLDTLLRLTEQMRAQSEYERAIEFARRVLDSDPANERAHQHLIFCYMASGNRQAALAQYEQCTRALGAELGVEPAAETRALYHWITHTAPAIAGTAARITNLPIPLTSFIGRKAEMAQAKTLLANARLLTLTGAGGSGKTRLSIQVATDLIDHFRDGAWWIEFAPLSDPALVPSAVAKALAVREETDQPLSETLASALRERKALLVFDNCEHLIGACAQIAEQLLQACPDLKILATSREPLGIPGEQVWQVPTLSVPSAQPLSVAQLLLPYESIRLFVERAKAIKPDFALGEQNALAIVQICRRLDGIPLAIELAAARIKALAPEQIAARLDDRFNLLTQGSRTALPRQQTLRALIDWSYELLTEGERDLFRCLAIFEGGWTLEAGEAIAPGGAILDPLSRLVDKSLVVAEERDGEARYRMLETIQEYAREKLDACGESERVADRHLDYFLRLAERAEPQLEGARQAEWFARLEQEHDNLRSALQRARSQQRADAGLRLSAALWRFWKVHGHYSEGRSWCDVFLGMGAAGTPELQAYRSRALYAAGMLAYHQSDFARASQFHEQGLTLNRAQANTAGVVRSLAGLGSAARAQGEYERANALFDEGLKLARASNDQAGVATCLKFLGLVAVAQGDAGRAARIYEEALPLYLEMGDDEDYANVLHNLSVAQTYLGNPADGERLAAESLTIRRRLGDPHGTALSLHTMSFFARQRGDWSRAKELLQEALRLYHSVGTKENTIECLESIAYLECELQQPERAAQIYGAASALRAAFAIPLQAFHSRENEVEVAEVKSKLDAQAFAAAWQQGSSLGLEQAIQLALGQRA